MAGKGKGKELLVAAVKRRRAAAEEETRREEESSSTTTTTTTLTNIDVSLDNLNVDLLLNILVRLPTAKSVFSSKLVSKGWCSLLENPYFVSNFISHHINLNPRNNPYHNLSFLLITRSRFREPRSWFFPTSDDLDESPKGFTLEFLPQGNEQDINLNFSVVASCNDLLFCVAKPEDSDMITSYYICNPFTRQWRLLPPPPPKRVSKYKKRFGLICEPNYQRWVQGQQYHSRFRAVCFNMMDKDRLSVDSYCSEIGQWIESVLLGPEYNIINSLFANIVSHDGKLHWYNGSDVVVYDPFDGQAIFIDGSEFRLLPILNDILNYNNPINLNPYYKRRVFRHCLGVCQGSLRFMQAFTINNYNPTANDHLSIWELKDYETRRFSLVHVICFNNMISKELWVSGLVERLKRVKMAWKIAFHPENKDVVYFGHRYHIISCNIQSGELEIIHQTPYESKFINLTSVFAIKLPWWPTPV